jgi:hypothetical protein
MLAEVAEEVIQVMVAVLEEVAAVAVEALQIRL